ncbi:MAG: RidA family protein [Curvibacter sp.]|nr:RidA family protein [Curvibacter sp.]
MDISRFEMGPRFSEMTVVDFGQGKLIYLAGQVAEDPSLDITGQTRQVLGFIDRLLAQAGADKTHIVQARIYLGSVGDYVAMNSVWDDWVDPAHTPARATVGAKLINREYKVEIECVAALPKAGA